MASPTYLTLSAPTLKLDNQEVKGCSTFSITISGKEDELLCFGNYPTPDVTLTTIDAKGSFEYLLDSGANTKFYTVTGTAIAAVAKSASTGLTITCSIILTGSETKIDIGESSVRAKADFRVNGAITIA